MTATRKSAPKLTSKPTFHIDDLVFSSASKRSFLDMPIKSKKDPEDLGGFEFEESLEDSPSVVAKDRTPKTPERKSKPKPKAGKDAASVERYKTFIRQLLNSPAIEELHTIVEEKGEIDLKDEAVRTVLGRLGENASLSDTRFLFNHESPALKAIVTAFLPGFFDKHGDLLRALHEEKREKSQAGVKVSAAPGCISFLLAKSEEANECFISVSSGVPLHIVNALTSFTETFNETSGLPPCHVIPDYNVQYNGVIEAVSEALDLPGASEPARGCAEKAMMSEITKHIHCDENFMPLATCNYGLFPYEKNEVYDGKKHFVSMPSSKLEKILAGDYKLIELEGCEHCRMNHPTMLAILAAAHSLQGKPLKTSPQKITLAHLKRKADEASAAIGGLSLETTEKSTPLTPLKQAPAFTSLWAGSPEGRDDTPPVQAIKKQKRREVPPPSRVRGLFAPT